MKKEFNIDCTAIGNLDHSLNQDCGIISTYLKGSPKRPHLALEYLTPIEFDHETLS